MSRGKRILMLLENGGFPEDTRVAQEAFALRDAGYQVRVISPTDSFASSKFEMVSGVATYRYPAPPEWGCLLYTSPSPRDLSTSRMPSSA